MDGLIMNAEEGKFVLRDIVYDVTGAVIHTVFHNMQIILSIDIEAEADDDDENDLYELSSVRLYHENGFNTHTASYEELKGKSFAVDIDPDSDEPEGALYVLEHEDITKSTVEILNVTDDKMTIRWSGLANVYWDEKYGEDVPFNTVVTVDIPKENSYELDLFESTSTKIDSNTNLEVLNLDEFNREVRRVSESRQWNDFNTVLKFRVSCGDNDYFGEVIFTDGKNNHVTKFDETCPRKVRFVSVDFNLSVDYEIFVFSVE